MKRSEFIKKSVLSGVTALAIPSLLRAEQPSVNDSTYDNLMEKVGYNHIPNNEKTTMNSVLYKAATRGHANHGWLDAKHSFSLANYHNPERMHFGVLRVLNDDKIAPARGFSTHPHDNMK